VDQAIDRHLRRIEEGLRRAADGAAALRATLTPSANAGGKPWAQMMLSVLAELERRGGRVRKAVFADIGEGYGYHRQGIAGFYQGLVSRDGGYTVLTAEGRARLKDLQDRYEELPPPA
jgi:hypothetical protein